MIEDKSIVSLNSSNLREANKHLVISEIKNLRRENQDMALQVKQYSVKAKDYSTCGRRYFQSFVIDSFHRDTTRPEFPYT